MFTTAPALHFMQSDPNMLDAGMGGKTPTTVCDMHASCQRSDTGHTHIGPSSRPAEVTGPTTSPLAILMCTYDGQRFLADQLDSIEQQTYSNWMVLVSDDSSSDGTRDILERYQRKWGTARLIIVRGPSAGFVANFLSLACKDGIHADFYAFSDQDDIWEPNKLMRALAFFDTVPAGLPALYCGRTRLVDEHNRDIGFSPLFVRRPSFSNALVQSIAGGNTMVFNQATRDLLIEAEPVEIASHDWWAYLVVSGCGGVVCYDSEPTIRYRQHAENLVGSNTEWRARLTRMRWLLKGRFRIWSDQHVAALGKLKARLAPPERALFERFVHAREQSLLPRLFGLWRCRLYRQTFPGNIGLIVAAILKKI